MAFVSFVIPFMVYWISVNVTISLPNVQALLLLSTSQQSDSLQFLSVDSLLIQAQRLSTVNPDSALTIAHKTLMVVERSANMRHKTRLYTTIGVILRYQDQYDSALHYHKRARYFGEQNGDSAEVAEVLLNTGGVYQSRGEYATAMDYYFQALVLFERTKQHQGHARAYASIGVVYCLQGNYVQALQYQQKALTLRQSYRDNQAIAHSWRNIGNVYESLGYADSAKLYYKRAVQLFSAVGDSQGVALSLSSLGSALDRFGDPNSGIQALMQALSLLQHLGDNRGIAVAKNTIARCYFHQQQYKQSIWYAEQALQRASEIGAWAEQRDAAKLLADSYGELGHTKTAFQYFRLFTGIKDSIVNLRNNIQIMELQARYDLVQKDRALAVIEHQRNLEQIQSKNQRLVFMITTIVLLLISGLAVNAYRLKRRTEYILRQQNEEILRQQDLLREQSEKISLANDELQTANALLAEKNETLTQLNNEKNEFLGIAAHDLKNPLTNILLSIQTIEEQYRSTPLNTVFELTNRITSAVEYMLTIIRNLLDVNKVETGNLAVQLEAIEASFIGFIADVYHLPALAKNLTLYMEPLPPELVLIADRNALQQVLENLLSNAMKFSPQDKRITLGITVHPMPNLSHAESPALPAITARIFIRDEGPGISSEDQQKLFTRFSRLTARPTGGEYSTGLGLSIVKKLVELMHGNVWCESTPGEGATFIVELPAQQTFPTHRD